MHFFWKKQSDSKTSFLFCSSGSASRYVSLKQLFVSVMQIKQSICDCYQQDRQRRKSVPQPLYLLLWCWRPWLWQRGPSPHAAVFASKINHCIQMACNSGVYLEGDLSSVGQLITLKQPPGCVLEHGECNAVNEVQHSHFEVLIWRCPLHGFLEHNPECLGEETERLRWLRDALCVDHLKCCNKWSHLRHSISAATTKAIPPGPQPQEAGETSTDQSLCLLVGAFSWTDRHWWQTPWHCDRLGLTK